MRVKQPKFTDLTPDQFNSIYPITHLSVYKSGVKLRRSGPKALSRQKPKRGKIDGLSPRSLSNLIWTGANTSTQFGSMLTLTYGKEHPVNGVVLKGHLNKFITYHRRMTGDKYSYLWVMEFQARGAPHFHLLTTIATANTSEARRAMAASWCKAVLGKGDRDYSDISTRDRKSLRREMMAVHEHPSSMMDLWSEGGAIRYICKYAAKLNQKTVPQNFRNAGRFWGASRDVSRSIRPLYQVPIASDLEARKYISDLGRDDVAEAAIIPTKLLTWN